MATIYRFIVEQKAASGGDGRKASDQTGKSAAKKGRSSSFFGGDKGGVEHNRKMRAINPLLNRITGGYWEKGMRLTRAGMGLANNFKKSGVKGVFTGPALYIILAFIVQALLTWQKNEMVKAQKENMQDFKRMENGIGAVHGQYKVSTNIITGRHTYNQNK